MTRRSGSLEAKYTEKRADLRLLQCSLYIIHPCLPCCYHFYRMCSPVDNSGTPQGISALEEHIFTIYLPAATCKIMWCFKICSVCGRLIYIPLCWRFFWPTQSHVGWAFPPTYFSAAASPLQIFEENLNIQKHSALERTAIKKKLKTNNHSDFNCIKRERTSCTVKSISTPTFQ